MTRSTTSAIDCSPTRTSPHPFFLFNGSLKALGSFLGFVETRNEECAVSTGQPLKPPGRAEQASMRLAPESYTEGQSLSALPSSHAATREVSSPIRFPKISKCRNAPASNPRSDFPTGQSPLGQPPTAALQSERLMNYSGCLSYRGM